VSLAGLACRGRYGWLRLSLWLIVALVVIWQLAISPFYVISHVPALAIFGVVGMAAGITFGVLLPFLLLSFVSGFYRERLKGLLHLGGAAPPPVMTSPAPAVAPAGGS